MNLSVETEGSKLNLKVHSWGGLGSQLFALSLIYDLKKKHPRIKVSLIHHTSGISERKFELESILEDGITLTEVNDYQKFKELSSKKISKLKVSTKKLIKIIFNSLSISVCPDNNSNEIKIYPWTVEIRGHYSFRPIGNEFLQKTLMSLENNKNATQKKSSLLAIHYRLGDLKNLREKYIVAPENLISALKKVLITHEIKHAVLFTESVSSAKQYLFSVEKLFMSFDYSTASTLELLKASINAQYFIGTNSKVSTWIIKFRDYLQVPSMVVDR